MMRFSRLNKMEEYIQSRDYVSLDELCIVFKKSKSTIRRDVAELASRGTIEKIYGGVKAAGQPANLISFSERIFKLASEKQTIGKIASEYVKDGDSIFIDSGTTTLNMIPFLSSMDNVTVLTNNLYVVTKCMEYPNLNTVSFGGLLNPKTASFAPDYYTLKHIRKFNIKKAFMSATGVSIDKGATNKAFGEINIKKHIANKSDTCFLMVDATKFGRSALMTFADLSDFKYVITDQKPPEEYTAFFNEHGIICRY